MKKKVSLLVLLVVCLSAASALAVNCSKSYETDCDGCNHEKKIFTCTNHIVSEVFYDECPDVVNCQIWRRNTEHVMIHKKCGYGGGAYNKDTQSYPHTRH